MKQLPLSSRGWVLVILASLIVMFGGIQVLKKRRQVPSGQDNSSASIPLNNLDSGSVPPAMPGSADFPSSSGSDTGSSASSGRELVFDVPPDSNQNPSASKEPPRMPVVWVTDTGAKAYSQPGFNMPVVKELEQWEELLIVETSRENWDRVQDLKGQQMWVQKKVLTIIRPQNLNEPSIAEKKVMDFYTQVAHREHSDAYVHLSPDWKRELSFDEFVKGYSRTDSLRSEIVNVMEIGQERYQVDVAMEALEEGNSVDYLGIYTVEKVDEKWYLTSGSLNKQAISGGA